MSNPFDYGAVYRVAADFDALRDRFVAGELVMYWRYGQSIYDGMQGFFFRQPGSEHVRSWDLGLGDDAVALNVHFALVSPPHPLIDAARRDDLAAAADETGDAQDPLWQLTNDLALEAAAEAGAADVLSHLLHRPISSAVRTRAFHGAATAGQAASLAVMLDAGTYVDLTDSSGQTALTHAACSGDLAAVALLLARGADPRHTTNGGTTALALARSRRHETIVEALERALGAR